MLYGAHDVFHTTSICPKIMTEIFILFWRLHTTSNECQHTDISSRVQWDLLVWIRSNPLASFDDDVVTFHGRNTSVDHLRNCLISFCQSFCNGHSHCKPRPPWSAANSICDRNNSPLASRSDLTAHLGCISGWRVWCLMIVWRDRELSLVSLQVLGEVFTL